MPYDGLFAAAVRVRLHGALADARIDKIYQPAPYTIILHLRRPGENLRLLLSADPQHARVHLTETSPPNPLQPPAFCMLLRKYLDPGKIVAVEQVGMDRILHVVIDGFDDAGRPARRRLIAELTGRNSNIVLVDEASGRIIDALRRVSDRVNRYRALLPGVPYVPPPPADKIDPRAVTAADLEPFARDLDPDDTVERLLTAALEGVGPFAAKHIALAAGIPPAATVGGLTELPGEPADGTLPELTSEGRAALGALADAARTAARAAESGSAAPVLVVDERGLPADFWSMPPLHVAPERVRVMPDPCAAVDAYYAHRLAAAEKDALRRRLARGLETALKRLRRKRRALEGDLEEAERAEEYRMFGELLTAHLHMVKQGSQAVVPNYYAGGEPVVIPMDPSLHPAVNAQRYFKRYNKAVTARRAVQEQLDAVARDIAYLEQALMHVETAATIEELEDVEAELAAAGFPFGAAGGGPGRGGRPGSPASRAGAGQRAAGAGRAAAAPLTARASDGSRILVGRSNRQNDQLTFRTARPDDVWLHVKDAPGAHVILQPAGGEPSDDALREAAELAAYFSRARGSSRVPVDWTRVKHVRKPKGARPGMVVYDHHQTIYVTPGEEAVRARLQPGPGRPPEPPS